MENEGGAVGSSNFGRLLRHYRLAAGLSQEALAERARMSANGIGALERGYRRSPQRDTLALLVSALALDEAQREGFEAAAGAELQRRGASVGVEFLAAPGAANLPFAQTSFVGRARELDEIATLLRDHRLVTLTGAGGVGKTQTALHVGAAQAQVNGTPICFVALAPINDPSLVATTIAAKLGVREVPNRPLLETMVGYFDGKTLLLILDNCEHVIDGTATFAQAALPSCPRVRILATSREPLRAAGEYTYRLPPLTFPPAVATRTLTAGGACNYGGVALFRDRACAVDHRFALTDQNAPIVGDVCRRLDGIPLAIELAAARVNVLSLTTLSEKLDHRFRILVRGERTALTRQQTMRATIDWSYDLLPSREQRVFEWLSVFAGGCTLEALTAVCATDGEGDLDVIDLITSLVMKSLLVTELVRGEQRYWLLESSREYAREKLMARGEFEDAARRHALFCADLAERLEGAWDTTSESTWLSRAKAESGNWRAALDWALGKRGDVIVGQRLAAARRVLCRSFPAAEVRPWLRVAQELVSELTPADLVARLELADAMNASRFRENRTSLAAAGRALARYRDLGDELGVAHAKKLAGEALVSLGRFVEGVALLRDVLAAARALGNRRLEVAALENIGSARSALGDFAGSRAHFAEALELADTGNEYYAITSNLALNEHNAGDPETALQILTSLFSTHRARFASPSQTTQTDIPEDNIAVGLVNMAEFLVALGRYDQARAQAHEALEFARRSQLDVVVAASLEYLALVAVLMSESEGRRTSDEYARAARLLGFVGARRDTLGFDARGLHEDHDRALAALRDVIGAEDLARLMAAGATLTQDEAIAQAYALE
ncbi:MAG: helix-turn-helix domain-containing protein [Candidatus Cybelea sp.]